MTNRIEIPNYRDFARLAVEAGYEPSELEWELTGRLTIPMPPGHGISDDELRKMLRLGIRSMLEGGDIPEEALTWREVEPAETSEPSGTT